MFFFFFLNYVLQSLVMDSYALLWIINLPYLENKVQYTTLKGHLFIYFFNQTMFSNVILDFCMPNKIYHDHDK